MVLQPNPPTTSQNSTEANQNRFRECLRQADRFILSRQFEQAKAQLAVAKSIDPTNPYIAAFEDRISLFEQKAKEVEGPSHVTLTDKPTAKTAKLDITAISKEALEQKLRQQIEAEYKTRFMQELKKAEAAAASSLEEEKKKLELQRQSLKVQYEFQLSEMQKRLEREYKERLEEEIASTEHRLRQQFQSEQAFIENEMKNSLTKHYESQIQQLEEKIKSEYEILIEKERKTFAEKENVMKEQYERKLLEALRKAESMFREQSIQIQQMEQERLRQQLENEFKTKLNHEREVIAEQFNKEKVKLEQTFLIEKRKVQDESRRQMEEQLKLIRQREEEEFERKKKLALSNLEADLKATYHSQIMAERKRIQEESERAIEAEKKRLQREFEERLRLQNEKILEVKRKLKNEMEQQFLKRLEQVAKEYDHKMELLGTKLPTTQEEKKKLYKERMHDYYLNGQPSVDDAKTLMELKELLELTFDEHLALESDVRLELYVENVQKQILAGKLNIKEVDKLNDLKKKFQISAEESARLEPYIFSSFQRLASKGRILVVDDEQLLLKQLDDFLTSSGFQVITASDVSTALKELNSNSVDLILSDIKFPEGELDGFSFFKEVQKMPHLQKVPFIFMSSLHDGVIIRSGVQLGVDDYLTKPIDPDLLIAVIEGKLKRYRSLYKN